ncbi:MAG TPA: arylsulfotransferase family protein, partial [Gemmataceae bacterium]
VTPAANSSIPPRFTTPKLDHKSEFLHTNSVKVLKETQAAKFPLFQAGQVLLSMRNLNTIAVVDRHTRSVVWAARGIWKAQHDAEFLDNGHLLLYDNYGTQKHTRIVEYDPQTQAIPWAYSGENSTSFVAFYRGMKQRLPNGNTLIVDPDARRLLEVTHKKEVVWENVCPLPAASPGQHLKRHAVTSAQRYNADELTFLNGVARARPPLWMTK